MEIIEILTLSKELKAELEEVVAELLVRAELQGEPMGIKETAKALIDLRKPNGDRVFPDSGEATIPHAVKFVTDTCKYKLFKDWGARPLESSEFLKAIEERLVEQRFKQEQAS